MDSPMEYLKENQATLDVAPSTAVVSMDEAAAAQQEKKAVRSTWPAWFNAFKQVLPIYILLHLAFLILTYLSALFIIGNFSPRTLRISTLWLAWLCSWSFTASCNKISTPNGHFVLSSIFRYFRRPFSLWQRTTSHFFSCLPCLGSITCAVGTGGWRVFSAGWRVW